MKKREAQFTTDFRHYIRANPPRLPCAIEIKQTTTNSLLFSAVKEHQRDALLAVKYNVQGFLYKIPDDSRGIKPFDMVYFINTQGYVVIKYPTFFCFIDIDTFLVEEQRSKRKSLTDTRAREIAYLSVDL